MTYEILPVSSSSNDPSVDLSSFKDLDFSKISNLLNQNPITPEEADALSMELRKIYMELLAFAAKHPKSVALWSEAEAVKEKMKAIEKNPNNKQALLCVDINSSFEMSNAEKFDSKKLVKTFKTQEDLEVARKESISSEKTLSNPAVSKPFV